MNTLEICDLTVRFGKQHALSGISGTLAPGITALLGPNGSGKSTFLRCLSKLVPFQGSVILDGNPLKSMEHHYFRCHIGGMPQELPPPAPFSVFDFVLLGRLPHHRGWRPFSDEDRRHAVAAAQAVDLKPFLDRPLASLSGGERQRAGMAQLLAQNPGVFLLDEPSSALDPRHVVRLFALLRTLGDQGRTVVVALHDVSLAARFSSHCWGFKGGKLLWEGNTAAVLSEQRLTTLFDVPFRRHTDSDGGDPSWHPVSGPESF